MNADPLHWSHMNFIPIPGELTPVSKKIAGSYQMVKLGMICHARSFFQEACVLYLRFHIFIDVTIVFDKCKGSKTFDCRVISTTNSLF